MDEFKYLRPDGQKDICHELVEVMERLGFEGNHSNAFLFATSKALSDSGIKIRGWRKNPESGKVETAETDPFTAMYNRLIDQGTVNQIIETLVEGERLQVKYRTMQLLYGLSTDEMTECISDDDIMKMLLTM